MRKKMFPCMTALLALAACNNSVTPTDSDGDAGSSNVHVTMGKDDQVTIDVPGFAAKLAVPSLNLGGNLDLDGIKVAPDTKVSRIDVTAQDSADGQDDGQARIGFTNPAAPAAVVDHYARAAAAAGYTDIKRSAVSLTARKQEKTFTVNVSSQGAGSQGTILMASTD